MSLDCNNPSDLLGDDIDIEDAVVFIREGERVYNCVNNETFMSLLKSEATKENYISLDFVPQWNEILFSEPYTNTLIDKSIYAYKFNRVFFFYKRGDFKTSKGPNEEKPIYTCYPLTIDHLLAYAGRIRELSDDLLQKLTPEVKAKNERKIDMILSDQIWILGSDYIQAKSRKPDIIKARERETREGNIEFHQRAFTNEWDFIETEEQGVLIMQIKDRIFESKGNPSTRVRRGEEYVNPINIRNNMNSIKYHDKILGSISHKNHIEILDIENCFVIEIDNLRALKVLSIYRNNEPIKITNVPNLEIVSATNTPMIHIKFPLNWLEIVECSVVGIDYISRIKTLIIGACTFPNHPAIEIKSNSIIHFSLEKTPQIKSIILPNVEVVFINNKEITNIQINPRVLGVIICNRSLMRFNELEFGDGTTKSEKIRLIMEACPNVKVF